MKTKEQKQEEAKARQEAYDKLSPKEKLARLDAMFGKGQGAARERQRLLKPKTFKGADAKLVVAGTVITPVVLERTHQTSEPTAKERKVTGRQNKQKSRKDRKS